LETNLHNTNLPTRSPTWTGLGLNPALRSQRPANNRLSCSTDLSETNNTGDLDVSGRIALKLILEAYGVRVWSKLKLLRIGFSGALSVDRWIPQWPIPVPLYRRLGGPKGRSARVRKISTTGIRPLALPARSESLFRPTCNKYSE
jgi:hypothetical protein